MIGWPDAAYNFHTLDVFTRSVVPLVPFRTADGEKSQAVGELDRHGPFYREGAKPRSFRGFLSDLGAFAVQIGVFLYESPLFDKLLEQVGV